MSTQTPETDDHATAPHLRCSDAEREAVAETLHRAVGEGRLTIEEGEERLGKVYEARFRHDLAALTTDLPSDKPVTKSSRVVAIWHVIRTNIALQFAILFGRHGASWRRRALAALALLGPVLVVLALAAGVLHGAMDWHDADHGYGHHAVLGPDEGSPAGT